LQSGAVEGSDPAALLDHLLPCLGHGLLEPSSKLGLGSLFAFPGTHAKHIVRGSRRIICWCPYVLPFLCRPEAADAEPTSVILLYPGPHPNSRHHTFPSAKCSPNITQFAESRSTPTQ